MGMGHGAHQGAHKIPKSLGKRIDRAAQWVAMDSPSGLEDLRQLCTGEQEEAAK